MLFFLLSYTSTRFHIQFFRKQTTKYQKETLILVSADFEHFRLEIFVLPVVKYLKMSNYSTGHTDNEDFAYQVISFVEVVQACEAKPTQASWKYLLQIVE